ncbi:hypothetical protein CMV_027232 [Castanea mollissima]|uniref:Uncharacterized protein n=1 Tax=Castanea mollissima TaxID=60419 RepID=A0A8J4QK78_9ROSI|nr:hypothetical protein CMV_027232 [Castanea mollissima]
MPHSLIRLETTFKLVFQLEYLKYIDLYGYVDLSNCYSLNAQSSSRLLNQIGEFLGILPNKACKGTRSRILMRMDPQTSSSDILDEIHPHRSPFIIKLPGTEIPKRLKLNHESDGNVISFWVGRKFPNIFFVCFAFGPQKYWGTCYCHVRLSINGCKKEQLFSTTTDQLSDHLWIVSFSNKRLQNRLNKSNPSERNYVEVICEMGYPGPLDTTTGQVPWVAVDWIKNYPRGWGVGVECICQWASNNGGGSRHQCEEETIHQPMPDVPKNATWPGFESDSNSGNGALVQPEFQLQRSCPGPLTEMEEIDPRAFNNGAEDSGLSIAHTYVNEGSDSKLYPPSKKAGTS